MCRLDYSIERDLSAAVGGGDVFLSGRYWAACHQDW
jgi:hypothetical protein